MSQPVSRRGFVAGAVAAAAGLSASRSSSAADVPAARESPKRQHPFLLITATHVRRAKTGIAQGGLFAALARSLVQRARSGKPEDLPPLERAWWETERHKPWVDTYAPIWHHTGIVPAQWARLAQDCARASLLFDEPDLKTKAKRVLLDLARYTFEFDHYDVGMNYTLWCKDALDAYDILYDSIDEAGHARMKAFFERFLAAVVKNDEYWIAHRIGGGEINNHYAWHKMGRVMIGLFFGRNELVKQAIDGPKGIDMMMRHGFRDEGLWLEAAIPYQFAQTHALMIVAEMLENAGYPLDLWNYPSGDGRTLKQSYDALFALLFPNRVLPPVGDCYGRRPHMGSYEDFEVLYRRFHEPHCAWLLRDCPDRTRRPLSVWSCPEKLLFDGEPEILPGKPPAMSTRLWPEHGYAALRTVEGEDYWSGRGWTVFATYADFNVHGNHDKLSIMLYGEGHLWAPRFEAFSFAEQKFAASIQRDLNRATLCQNTVMVGEADQAVLPRKLDLVEFHSLPDVKRLSIGDLAGRLYPGVRQLRTVIARNEYVFDFFELESSRAQRYTWLFHVDGVPKADSAASWGDAALLGAGPWKYLRDMRQASGTSPYWEVFQHDEQQFRVDLVSDGPVTIKRCSFPADDTSRPATLPMLLVGASRAKAWFAAVYRSGAGPADGAKITLQDDVLNSYLATLTIRGKTFTHRIPKLAGLR